MEDYMDFFEIKFDEDFVSGVRIKHRYVQQGKCYYGDGSEGPAPQVFDAAVATPNKAIESMVLDKATLTKKEATAGKLKK